MHAHLLAALRADLSTASFRVDTLRELWGPMADAALGRGDRVPAARALESRDEPAAILARLFVLGIEVDAAEVAAAGCACERFGATCQGEFAGALADLV